jgi:hypothetical protein
MLRRGMVEFRGKTYRIVKVSRGKYEVYRILDDCRIGTFESTPRLRVEPEGVEATFLHELAITALKLAKVSWGTAQPPEKPAQPETKAGQPQEKPARDSATVRSTSKPLGRKAFA